MHELALSKSILDITLAEAERHQAQRVLSIRIKAGALAGVIPALIQEYFNIISAGTLAESARLNVEAIPATMECLACGASYEAEGYKIICPACGGGQIRLLTGREFFIESLEVE